MLMYYKDCVFPIKWKTLMEKGMWYSMEPSQIEEQQNSVRTQKKLR